MTRERYHIGISWSDEDACFVADVPDLESCSAFGSTPEKALAEVRVAMKNWLAAARKLGRPIPEPTCRLPVHRADPAARGTARAGPRRRLVRR